MAKREPARQIEPFKQAAYELGRQLARKSGSTTHSVRRELRITDHGVEMIEQETTTQDWNN